VREIARHFRIPSTKTVADLLGSLATKGYIRRVAGRSRGVVLVGFAGGAGTQPVPVVRPGPDRAMIVEEHLTLDRSLLPADDAYLVRASVEDAPTHAIREGDLLLVHPGARAREDGPIVARIGGAILARTLERRGVTLVLRAPRPGGDDITIGPGDDFQVLGPLSGVFRVSPVRADAIDDESPPR
jgi:repressor LexA